MSECLPREMPVRGAGLIQMLGVPVAGGGAGTESR